VRLDECAARELWKSRKSDEARAALEQARELLKSLRPARGVRKARPEQAIKSFYNSWQWKRLRYRVLKERGRACECCKATAADGAKIVVDHVHPIRRFFHLRLDAKNLQVLCDSCNRGKGSHDATDWRKVKPQSKINAAL
jgi:5-methylcytosine-specific restriction endonuclease McrA